MKILLVGAKHKSRYRGPVKFFIENKRSEFNWGLKNNYIIIFGVFVSLWQIFLFPLVEDTAFGAGLFRVRVQ